MTRAMHRWRYALHVPDDMKASWGCIAAAQERAAREGQEPAVAELAAVAGCSPSVALSLLAATTPPVHLDAPLEDAESPTARCRELPCPRAPSEAAIVSRLHVEAAVARLPHRWQTYVRLRFGLDGGEPLTQREAAQVLGCSRQRAGKIEQDALARLEQILGPPRRRPQAGG
jgi:RNA polymerase primary sigma factor